MSHHLDSPLARQDVRLDITDLYVFCGETGTVFVMNCCHSIAGKIPVPGYHPEGMYEFKIDLNGDAVEELTYRMTFEPRDVDKQRYSVRRFTCKDATDPFADGTVVAEGITGEKVTSPGGLRVWAGQAGDPFWIDPDLLHAVLDTPSRTVQLSAANIGNWTSAEAKNLFAGHTVYSMVLEIPDRDLLQNASDDSRRIGVWAVSTLATDAGGWRSINRVGLPMLPPLFTQFNESLGDTLNAGCPSDDFKAYGGTVIKEISAAVTANGTSENAKRHAETVARRIFPNLLPYTVGTPAVFGFAEWNGRSLTDNTPEVMFSFALNTPICGGLSKESVTSKPTKSFLYVHPVALN